MKSPCSGNCGRDLYIKDSTAVGYDHRTNQPLFTCRSCHMLAGAKANLELAQKWMEMVT